MILPSGFSTLSYRVNAQGRGWGPGWPNCQVPSTIITLARSGQRLSVNTRTARLWTLLLNQMEHGGYLCHTPEQWCWGGACRAISGTNTPSNHSWWNAVDINAPANPYSSSGQHDIPPSVYTMFRRFGFGLGADYTGGKKDWMHVEFMGTPTDADVMTAAAEREFGSGAVAGTPFPLPAGWYFGPFSGPNESISGYGKSDARWRPFLAKAQQRIGTAADGYYGPNTKAAAVRWQNSHGLSADGLIGARTWATLGV